MKNANKVVLHFKTKKIIWLGLALLSMLTFCEFNCAYAGSNQTLGDIALNVTSSMSGLAKLITAVSYVAGIGFAMMGLLKFKAHKDNPTQVHLSQAFVLIVISVGLIFLPNLISTGGTTIWGEQANQVGARSDQFNVDNLG